MVFEYDGLFHYLGSRILRDSDRILIQGPSEVA